MSPSRARARVSFACRDREWRRPSPLLLRWFASSRHTNLPYHTTQPYHSSQVVCVSPIARNRGNLTLSCMREVYAKMPSVVNSLSIVYDERDSDRKIYAPAFHFNSIARPATPDTCARPHPSYHREAIVMLRTNRPSPMHYYALLSMSSPMPMSYYACVICRHGYSSPLYLLLILAEASARQRLSMSSSSLSGVAGNHHHHTCLPRPRRHSDGAHCRPCPDRVHRTARPR